MTTKFHSGPRETKEDAIYFAHLILTHAHNTSKSFLDIYVSIRKASKAKGASTHEQQDLLRAMLLFASAGLRK